MAEFEKLLRPYLRLFSGREDCVAGFDSAFRCVVGNSLFAPGDYLMSFLKEPVPDPLHDMAEAPLYKDERFYCCRIMPVKNSAGESEAYICELISTDEARSICEKADIASELLPLFNTVEFNSASIWKSAGELRKSLMESGDYADLALVMDVEKSMANIAAATKNAFEYSRMLQGSQSQALIDAADLCRILGSSCNAALAKCGRRVEVLVAPDDLRIYADSRRAVVALVNAIQNALLYSPRDTEPVLAVYRKTDHGRSFVEIRITNENIMFTQKDFKDRVDINFSFQRLGFGIPIIRKFSQSSGGVFSMTEEDGKVIVTLTLPAAPAEHGSVIRLNSPSLTRYITETPDLMEVMMREVVQFFGEKTAANS